MVDCCYPNCEKCEREDCNMEQKDIQAMLKRRRYQSDPEKYRKELRNYRELKRNELPKCNECDLCILVQKEKMDGCRRLCIDKMRLIEQKVSTSPQWCKKRTPSKDYLKRRENILRQKREKYNLGKV